MKKKLFISYGNDNFNKVKLVVKNLENHPLFSPVVVANKREANKALVDKVTEGINDADYIIPILTKDSIHNQWINQEIGYASAKGKKIIPIIEESIMAQLKGFIHKQNDLPYKYKTKDDQQMREENKSFMNCFRLLIQDLEEELAPNSIETKLKITIPVKQSIDPVTNAINENFPSSSSHKVPLVGLLRSGEKCPEGGVWQSQTSPSEVFNINEGETFPQWHLVNVLWKLISYS
jgi:nucleoside 2-deoxyribosyltransferase